MRVELDKSLRETEAWFNDSTVILDEFGLERAPHYSSFCRWEQQFQMRELRRLLRQSAEQAGWSGEAAIDATGFQRDQTSYHYRKRANFSFQAMKTTILIDVNSLAIKDVHYTTRKSWDGYIGMQVFRVPAEDLRLLAGDANYSWSDLREECRGESTRPLIRHREQTPLKEAHNARMDDEVYHQRWMSETGFSLLKEDDGEKLRSRSWHGQFRELTRRCIVHNLSQAARTNSPPALFLRCIDQRYHRHHLREVQRHHVSDWSQTVISGGYCIFYPKNRVSHAVEQWMMDPTPTLSCEKQGTIACNYRPRQFTAPSLPLDGPS